MKIRADVNAWLREASAPVLRWIESVALRPGAFNRVVLSNVPAHKGILPHTDDRDILTMHGHLPILTHPDITLRYPQRQEAYHLKRGHIYRMDKNQEHAVENPTRLDRVHLLFAYWPHDGQWDPVFEKGVVV